MNNEKPQPPLAPREGELAHNTHPRPLVTNVSSVSGLEMLKSMLSLSCVLSSLITNWLSHKVITK